MCQKHPTEQLNLFCSTCDVDLCGLCYSADGHAGHEIEPIESMYEKHREEMEKTMVKGEMMMRMKEEIEGLSQDEERSRGKKIIRDVVQV